MLIKTVTSVITTNSAGQTVESLPIRQAVAGETDIIGRPIDVITVEESEVGVPVRFVTGKAVLNSAGQWVDTIPVQGGGGGPDIPSAVALLTGEPDGLAIDFLSPGVCVKDTTVPANTLYALPDSLIVTTRTTAGWYFGPDGVLKQAAANVARFDHDIRTLRPLGMLCEATAQNIVLRNRDLTQAVWTKNGITAAKNQVGLDADAASASSIVATADGGTILQAISGTATFRATSAYVKRLGGTGAVEMTQDGGATWTQITIPVTGWGRVSLPAQSTANTGVGFRLTVSGDSIAVDLVQCEAGRDPSSPIPTAATAVTRAPEQHSIDLSRLPWNVTAGTMFVDCVPPTSPQLGGALVKISDGSNNNSFIATVASDNAGTLQIRSSGTLEANLSATRAASRGTVNRLAATWTTNHAQVALNAIVSPIDAAVSLPAVTTLQVGGNGTDALRGHLRNLVLIPRTVDANTLALIAMHGFPALAPAVNIAPNHPAIIDSDFVSPLVKTDTSVSGIRPLSDAGGGYQYANPGWRRRFITNAPFLTVHLRNSNQIPGDSYNGRTLIFADGVKKAEVVSPKSENVIRHRVDFADDAQIREIEILTAYGASIEHLGLTVPSGYSITAAPSRDTLPLAAFGGGSRVNGFNATGPDITTATRLSWTDQLCRAKGWRQANFGAAGRKLVAADGTLIGSLNPDVAFLQADINDLLAQTSIATYKERLTEWIGNFRQGAPVARLYVITSIWITAAWDNRTIKIADYRTAATEVLTALADSNNILVDGLTLVSNAVSHVSDGLHPNDAGTAEWATNLAAVADLA